MTIRQAKRVPYASTTIQPENTQAQIQRLLYDYGVAAVQWTDVQTPDGSMVELRFIVKDEAGRPVSVRVRPPMMTVRRRERGRHGSTQTQVNKAASMRLLLWWLKSKLEAVSYGLVGFEEEFLANISGHLPSGEEVTVGEIIVPRLVGLDPTALAKALPAPKEDRA